MSQNFRPRESNNYKKLKKGTQIYYDRESVAFRGPFTFEKILRGPNILITGRDIGYLNKIYKFTLPVSKLKTDILYFQVGKSPRRKTTKRKRTIQYMMRIDIVQVKIRILCYTCHTLCHIFWAWEVA